MRVYVGMALTEAPPEFRVTFQSELKRELRKIPDIEILDFVGLENGTAVDVYGHDRTCTETADLCVFVCDYASTGLGMEIVFRHFSSKPMLLFVAHERRVTRMLLGFAEKEGIQFYRYLSVAGITEMVRKEHESQISSRRAVA